MHPLFQRASTLTGPLIGAAIEVHRELGLGLIDSIYEWCLQRELELQRFVCKTQESVHVRYKGFVREESLRFDLLVEHCLLVEVKAVEQVAPIHKARTLSEMKLLDVPSGLVINFNVSRLVDGVSRLMLRGADK